MKHLTGNGYVLPDGSMVRGEHVLRGGAVHDPLTHPTDSDGRSHLGVGNRLTRGYTLLESGETPIENMNPVDLEELGFTGGDTDVDPTDSYSAPLGDLRRFADPETDFLGEFFSPEFMLVEGDVEETKVDEAKPKKTWMTNFRFGRKRDEAIAGEHDLDLGHETSLGVDLDVGCGIGSGHKMISDGEAPYARRGRRKEIGRR